MIKVKDTKSITSHQNHCAGNFIIIPNTQPRTYKYVYISPIQTQIISSKRTEERKGLLITSRTNRKEIER